MPESFSFTPQFATIRSSSPLEGMRPVQMPEVRHSALSFSPQNFLDVKSTQPELVAQGLASGLTEGIGGALKGITAAYVGEREKKEKDKEAIAQRKHEKEIWDMRTKAAKPENERDVRYENLRNQLTEKRLLEMENRMDSTLPTKVREKGFFRDTGVDAGIDLPEWGTEEIPAESIDQKQSSLMNLQVPVSNVASNEPLPILSNINNISAFAPPVEGYSLAGVSAPKTADRIFPPSEGQATLGNETMELMPVSGAEGTPVQPSSQADLSKLTPASAEFVKEQPKQQKRKPTPYEIEQYYAGEPFGSIADANFARREMEKLGYKAKVTPIEDPTTKKRIYYVEYEQAGEEPTKGLKLVDVTEKDGVMTRKYEPEISPKKKIQALDSGQFQLEAMVKSIEDIKKLQGEGFLPEVGRASSWLAKMPITTDASRVRALLKPVLAGAAFKAITEMRAASPTGAAVGGVSDKDLELLMSTMGALDPDNLDDPYFTENLNKIKELATKTISGIQNEKVHLLQNKSGNPEMGSIPLVETAEDYDAIPEGGQYYAMKTGELKVFTKNTKKK